MNAVEERRYGDLLREKRPHVIRTEAENEAALQEVQGLLARGDALSPPEVELLGLLTVLIERFEEEHYSMSPASPREILQELMSARGMTQKDLTVLFPSKGIASEVLAGKRPISNAQAKKLGAHFGVPATLFIHV